ncbi:MAG: hypothetical protein PHY92_04620, partial [Alphaproteobacteria bacterium]|nr:hypothetical protein [Alphaproteobacteria bacterium]
MMFGATLAATAILSPPVLLAAPGNYNKTTNELPNVESVIAGKGNDGATASAAFGPFESATASNWVNLAAVRDNLTLGTVEAYVDKQGFFLRMNRVVGLLGLVYNRQETPETAEIVLKDGSTIFLDFEKREFIENNNHHSFYHNDIYKKEDEYYANTDLLNRIFPHVAFTVDLASQKADFSTVGGESKAKPSDLAPTPQAAPVQPVIIDDMTGRQRMSGSSNVRPGSPGSASDVLQFDQNAMPPEKKSEIPEATTQIPATIGSQPPKEKETSSLPVEAPAKIAPKPSTTPEPGKDEEKKDGEPLILQPRIKKLNPNNEFIEALDFGDQIFLPLDDLIQMFEFPIKVDKDKKTAGGFFFAPENTFFLDTQKKEVRVGDKRLDLTQNNIRLRDGQIYVSSKSFAEWFGIESVVDRSRASIQFTTDKLLPQEEQEERQNRWKKLINAVGSDDKNYPVLQNPYQAGGYPAIDVNIGSSYMPSASGGSGSDSDKSPFSANYNIQGSTDLAYLTSKFYAQGSLDGGALSLLRFQAGR